MLASLSRSFRLLLAVVSAVLLSVSAFADKTTSDPNSAGSRPPAETASQAPDARLAKPVSYSAVGTRLHTLAEDVSKATGVSVRCGSTAKDWQIRDLPVTVIVTKLPLGKLLRAVADATHSDLRRERSEANGKTVYAYRFVKDGRLAAEIETFIAKQRASEEAVSRWKWDALVRFADLPESGLDVKFMSNDYDAREAAKAVSLGKLLKALGPDGRDSVLAGNPYNLTSRSFADTKVLHDFYRQAGKEHNAELTDRDLDACSARISLTSGDRGYNRSVAVSYCLVSGSSTLSAGMDLSIAERTRIFAKDRQQFTMPDELYFREQQPDKQLEGADDLSSDAGYLGFSMASRGGTYREYRDGKMVDVAPGWKRPELASKVKIELPRGSQELSVADVFAALPKAAGYSLVCDDFESHKHVAYSRVKNVAGREMTMGELLVRLEEFRWFVDGEHKLIIGRPSNWLARHDQLMPEAVLAQCRKEADGPGIELDSFLELSRYTLSQRQTWFRESRDLFYIDCGFGGWSASDLVWALYARLTPEQKAAAKSDAGILLADFDCGWIADFIKEGSTKGTTFHGGQTPEDTIRLQEEEQRKLDAMSNPDTLSQLVLKIRSQPSTRWTRYDYKPGGYISTSRGPMPDKIVRHIYRAELQGEVAGKQMAIAADSYRDFPVYSPKRQKVVDAIKP